MIEPVYDRFGVTVYHGDNLDVLRGMPDCSVDSIVTDPPAGVSFARVAWDDDRGGRRQWVDWLTVRMREALRVLKPGGHAVVWALPRTSHWTAWALEDAGFELRDCIQHLYDGGFPKSLDVAKAIDRHRDDREAKSAVCTWLADQAAARGFERREIDQHLETSDMAGWWLSRLPHRCAVPNLEQWDVIKRFMGLPSDMDAEVARLNGRKGEIGEAWQGAEVIGTEDRFNEPSGIVNFGQGQRTAVTRVLKAPNSDASRQWQGWGTGLRPAAEPWWLVRKPMQWRTVAQCVQEFGTGALNLDAVRGPDGQWPANATRHPKAPQTERPMVNGKQHPTVKSVALCRHFVRLTTQPGGTVLDLFAGSGPVGQAARAEGMKAVLIEQDADSIGFIRARLDARPKTQAGAATSDDGEPVDLLDLLGGDAS